MPDDTSAKADEVLKWCHDACNGAEAHAELVSVRQQLENASNHKSGGRRGTKTAKSYQLASNSPRNSKGNEKLDREKLDRLLGSAECARLYGYVVNLAKDIAFREMKGGTPFVETMLAAIPTYWKEGCKCEQGAERPAAKAGDRIFDAKRLIDGWKYDLRKGRVVPNYLPSYLTILTCEGLSLLPEFETAVQALCEHLCSSVKKGERTIVDNTADAFISFVLTPLFEKYPVVITQKYLRYAVKMAIAGISGDSYSAVGRLRAFVLLVRRTVDRETIDAALPKDIRDQLSRSYLVAKQAGRAALCEELAQITTWLAGYQTRKARHKPPKEITVTLMAGNVGIIGTVQDVDSTGHSYHIRPKRISRVAILKAGSLMPNGEQAEYSPSTLQLVTSKNKKVTVSTNEVAFDIPDHFAETPAKQYRSRAFAIRGWTSASDQSGIVLWVKEPPLSAAEISTWATLAPHEGSAEPSIYPKSTEAAPSTPKKMSELMQLFEMQKIARFNPGSEGIIEGLSGFFRAYTHWIQYKEGHALFAKMRGDKEAILEASIDKLLRYQLEQYVTLCNNGKLICHHDVGVGVGDYEVIRGRDSVVIELKQCQYTQIRQGLEAELTRYMIGSSTRYGIYLIFASGKKFAEGSLELKQLKEDCQRLLAARRPLLIDIMIVPYDEQASASKAKGIPALVGDGFVHVSAAESLEEKNQDSAGGLIHESPADLLKKGTQCSTKKVMETKGVLRKRRMQKVFDV